LRVVFSVLNGSEITSPFEAELSGISPVSLEVVESVLLFSMGDSGGRLPVRSLRFGTDFSLANVSLFSITVVVVPFASGVGSVNFSTSFGVSFSIEPSPVHLVTVSVSPVILDGFTVNPCSSDGGVFFVHLVSDELKSVSLFSPLVDSGEITTPRVADLSGVSPGLLVFSHKVLKLIVDFLEIEGSFADESKFFSAHLIVPFVATIRSSHDSTHLFLVLSNLLRLSSFPEVPLNTVLSSSIRPIPFSFNVKSVSSHPGLVRISNNLRDVVLFSIIVDGGKLTRVFGIASSASFSPGSLFTEEFVIEFRFVFRKDRYYGSATFLHADERLFGVTESMSVFLSVFFLFNGSTILVRVLVRVSISPVSLKLSHLFGAVRPFPLSLVLEIVVADPRFSTVVLFKVFFNEVEFFSIRDGSEITTGLHADISGIVPGSFLILRDPESPGVSGSLGRRSVVTHISRPVNGTFFVHSHDSSSLTDSDGSSVSSIFLFSVVDSDPGHLSIINLSFGEVSVSKRDNERSFHTNSNIVSGFNSFNLGPVIVVFTVVSVDESVLSNDNGVTLEVDRDSVSISRSSLLFPLSKSGILSVVKFTVLGSSPEHTFKVDTEINNLKSLSFNVDPFLRVESEEFSFFSDSYRVAIGSGSNSSSVDVVTNFSPDISPGTV